MDSEYIERLVQVEQRSLSNCHRLDELEEKTNDMADLITSVKVLALRQENVENDLKEIKANVQTITEKSGKRWDSTVETVIGLVISALVTFILMKIGIAT